MNVNEELQRWGEAPLTAGEEELLALLDALRAACGRRRRWRSRRWRASCGS